MQLRFWVNDVMWLKCSYREQTLDFVSESRSFDRLWMDGGAAAVVQRWPVDELPGKESGQEFNDFAWVHRVLNRAWATCPGEDYPKYEMGAGTAYLLWRRFLRDYIRTAVPGHLETVRRLMRDYPQFFTARCVAEECAVLGFDPEFALWLVWDRVGADIRLPVRGSPRRLIPERVGGGIAQGQRVGGSKRRGPRRAAPQGVQSSPLNPQSRSD